MIESFAHKGLKRFYEDQDERKLPPDMLERIAILLAALDEAKVVEDLDRPSFRLHKLRGDLVGYWAITVRANWRIVFRFEDGNASNVDFLDYH
jgi:proteic killer suppression protein